MSCILGLLQTAFGNLRFNLFLYQSHLRRSKVTSLHPPARFLVARRRASYATTQPMHAKRYEPNAKKGRRLGRRPSIQDVCSERGNHIVEKLRECDSGQEGRGIKKVKFSGRQEWRVPWCDLDWAAKNGREWGRWRQLHNAEQHIALCQQHSTYQGVMRNQYGYEMNKVMRLNITRNSRH